MNSDPNGGSNHYGGGGGGGSAADGWVNNSGNPGQPGGIGGGGASGKHNGGNCHPGACFHLKLLDRVSTILAVVEVVSVDTINLLEEVEADWWLLNIPLNIKLNYFLLWMYTKFFRHIFVSKNLN